MNEEWPVFEDFDPILIQNYIRFETAARHIRNQEAGKPKCRRHAAFKFLPKIMKNSKVAKLQHRCLDCPSVIMKTTVLSSPNRTTNSSKPTKTPLCATLPLNNPKTAKFVIPNLSKSSTSRHLSPNRRATFLCIYCSCHCRCHTWS